MTDPLVSVVIPHLDERELLRECLESFEDREYEPLELVVVDNGSTDGSLEMLRSEFPHVELVEVPSDAGMGRVNNAGLERASGDVLAFFFNNDEVIRPGWIRRLVEALQDDPDLGVVSGLRLRYDDPETIDAAGAVVDGLGRTEDLSGQPREVLDDTELRSVDYVEVPVFERELWEEIGPIDETYEFYSEDADFCLRAKERGYDVAVVPDAVTLHRRGGSRGGRSAEFLYYRHRNRIRMFLLRMPFPQVLLVTLWWAVVEPVVLTGFALAGRTPYAGATNDVWDVRTNVGYVGAIARALLWNALQLPDTLRTRRAQRRGDFGGRS